MEICGLWKFAVVARGTVRMTHGMAVCLSDLIDLIRIGVPIADLSSRDPAAIHTPHSTPTT